MTDEDDRGEGEQEETKRQLEEVARELKNRENKLAAIRQEIVAVEFKLNNALMGKALREGDAARIVAAAQFKERLRDELAKKQQAEKEAADSVQKAKERYSLLEEELAGDADKETSD